jgi:hypothetical protein
MSEERELIFGLEPHAPLSLEDAARICLNGYVKAATLRAAASRGELKVAKLGRRYLVTPAAIREWIELCQERQRERVSGSERKTSDDPCGSSKTDTFSVALAAAWMRTRG